MIPNDCIIPKDTIIEENVEIGHRVTLSGSNITIGKGSRLDSDCVIGEGVTISCGAWIREGAVVLKYVPPNAIIEGNPGRISGYCGNSHHRLNSQIIKSSKFNDNDRPSILPLNVGKCSLYIMRRFDDIRGSLSVGELPSELPFSPARYFIVFNVPSAEHRGEHAHKKCKQFLICLKGSCRVLLDDGQNRCEVYLDSPDVGVFMLEMIWGTQYRYSPDALLLVFASNPYDDKDYFRDYSDFISAVKNQKR